ncbi:MAG: hypothetical protein Q8L95_00905 [Burkholderiales bacterium]|nr:hypothetical protein [Burkholderiales bacterium]
MSATPLHRYYTHYSELPMSLRILYTAALCILGMGYLFALIYLFHTYSGRDGNPMDLTYSDLVIAYTGSGKGSKLESSLRGPMSAMLPKDEAAALINWVQQGADRPTYDTFIAPTLEKRCISCHDGSNPHLVNLSGYDNIKKMSEQDTGTAIFTLVRVSHIHLFGITFIFFIAGIVFSHAYVRPLWLKYVVMGAPFVCLLVDVSSWYMVKIYHPFAWVTMTAGAMLGMCFAFMWVTSMYQMWIGRTPKAILERGGGDITVIG